MENSEPNQNKQLADEVSLGEASFTSDAEFRNSEDRDIFTAARIRRFSQYVLSVEAWFRTANELIPAMNILEPHVESFWEDFRSLAFIVDQTSDPPLKHQKDDVKTKYSVINQHMMLAGFAIENLCKGYLAGLLTPEQQEDVKAAGELPEKLKTHNLVELVRSTGMTFSDREKDLLRRIGESAIWRGRYPSPTYHDKIVPFVQWEDDIGRIKTFLPKLRTHVGAKDS
jgi:hypothetical protein